MLNRSFNLGMVSEVCEISYKFILENCLKFILVLEVSEISYKFIVANCRWNTFTTKEYQWTENIFCTS